MFWAVVPLSRHTRDYGAVLGITTAYLVPMAAWVAFGPWLGFVRGPFRRLLVSGLALAGSGAGGQRVVRSSAL